MKNKKISTAIIGIILTLCMVMSIAPMGVSAAGEAFIVSGGEIGKDYTYAGGVLTVLTSTAITVKNEDPSVATTDHIVVKKDISANITLAGVNISTGSNSPFSPFTIEDDSTGDVTVTLAENSVNSLTSNHIYFAGLQKNGGGADIGKLTITGTGKLTAYASYDAAGIGSFYQFNVSNITISGGVIEATGSNAGAGIGSGGSTNDSGFYASNITITGGTVTAQSSGRGAGIGGGFSCDGSNITISGGTVTATSKGGAGIGGGYQGVGSNITISGGVVNATGGDNGAAGIGGGSQGNGSNITISGGTVTATSNEDGAGIGGGAQGVGSNITISGGTVTANGGKNGAGIGGGAQGNGSNITISGGTVTAKGGSHGAGIGGGEKLNGSNITISGGVVKATGGDNGAAGIGGGLEGDGSNITISGGTVTATSNKDGAGIGGGLRGDGSNITISGGSVHAIGDKAAIGGGHGAVTPKNGDDEDVYLLDINNPDSEVIMIDGKVYPPNHTAIDPEDKVLHAYVTRENHEISFGKVQYTYTFNSDDNSFTKSTTPSVADISTRWGLDVTATDNNKTLVFGEDYGYGCGILNILTDKGITIKNKAASTATTDHIVVKKDISANITLAGVNISTSSAPAFKIDDNSTGDVTVTLAENSVNVLTTTKYGCAGLQKNGSGDGIGKLTITGKGYLAATGGYDGGAGIGGGNEKDGSNITITDSTVTATAGIGGAGIGGGAQNSGSNITIVNSTVIATGDVAGAGIGGGNNGEGINITILNSTVTANGGRYGAGIGGGNSGTGSNITISGGSVRAVKGKDAPNNIGGGKTSVIPKNADKHDVYLMTIPNPSTAKVYIDNAEYKPSNHSAIDKYDTNLYAYVTGAHHTVKVGTETSCYHFTGTAMVKCTLKSDYSTDTAGNHWLDCTDENCGVQHDFAQHTFNQVVDSELKTGVAANCQHGTEYYKSCICGAKGTEKFYGTDVDSSNHVGTLGDWQITDSEHWKEYSECGCKEYESVHKDENPVDHKCDDCEKVLSVCKDENEDHFCDYCGKSTSGHDMKHHDAAEPECTVNGNTEYYECEFCGKYYSDANGKNEILLESTVIPATGHSYEWGECTECGSDDPEACIVVKIFRFYLNWLTKFVESCETWLKEAPVSILYWFIGIFTGDTKIF